MKRLTAMMLVASLGVGLGGCASSGTNAQPTVAVARTTVFLASGATHQDSAPRGNVMSEPTRGADTVRSGIPTPEPAMPQREQQLAGPTPQLPIPGGGRAGIPAY